MMAFLYYYRGVFMPPFHRNGNSVNINKYKNRTSVHENQFIKDLFTQTLEERRLKRIWPEDLLDEV
jgi:hypothetical protein